MILHQSPSLSYPLTERHFSLSFWQNMVNVILLKGGRGASLKIKLNDKPYVLRRYLRGGLIAKFTYDLYFWCGAKNTRPYQEYRVLNYAKENGLSVPECIAFYVDKQGLFYRAAIITEYLTNIGTLASYLNKHSLSKQQWQILAHQIKLMHSININHDDLNADNILVHKNQDSLTFSLIDFDKAKIEKNNKHWPKANIERLLRSLNKLKPIYFNLEGWAFFEQAYYGLD